MAARRDGKMVATTAAGSALLSAALTAALMEYYKVASKDLPTAAEMEY